MEPYSPRVLAGLSSAWQTLALTGAGLVLLPLIVPLTSTPLLWRSLMVIGVLMLLAAAWLAVDLRARRRRVERTRLEAGLMRTHEPKQRSTTS